MSTKAEVAASIEAISKATATAASVAAALKESVPSATRDIVFLKSADGQIVVYSETGVTDIKWTYVSNTSPNWPWYGGLGQPVKLPFVLKPAFQKETDFIKVFYGVQYAKSVDSPKTVVPTEPTVPATPTTGVSPQKFVSQMTVNINFERLRPTYMKFQGAPCTQRPVYDYLVSKGLSGVRFFIPYRADRDMGIGTDVPTQDKWDPLLDAAQAAMDAGMQVMMGCTDVVGEGPIKYDDWKKHADNVAKRVAERGFDPSKFALEVANELGGHDNAFWNDMRNGVHDVIRARLPNHIIIHGCCNWNAVDGWNDTWAMPKDRNIVLQFHDYVARSDTDWSKVGGQLTDFAAKRGVPIINGEQGIPWAQSGQENAQQWMNNLWNMAKGAGVLRPCPWTITGDPNGGAFRLNRDGADPTLLPLVEQSIPYLVSFVKQSPGWGQ